MTCSIWIYLYIVAPQTNPFVMQTTEAIAPGSLLVGGLSRSTYLLSMLLSNFLYSERMRRTEKKRKCGKEENGRSMQPKASKDLEPALVGPSLPYGQVSSGIWKEWNRQVGEGLKLNLLTLHKQEPPPPKEYKIMFLYVPPCRSSAYF